MSRKKNYAALDCMMVFIIQYKREHDGVSPAFKEIMAACNISSTSLVSRYLDNLYQLGKLTHVTGSRMIQVTGGAWNMEADNE